MFNWDEKPELNITPFVDVMLVLLAILMVTTPAIIYEEQITLPTGSKSKKVEELSTIEIRIDSKKNIKFKEQQFSFTNFADNFHLLTNGIDKKTPVFISADKKLLYDDVIFILKTVKTSGFSKVSLITDG